MRMIPSRPHEKDVSYAEKAVFRMLRTIDLGPAVGLHSLNLHRHERKRYCEADFILVCRGGIFVLEVKGGAVSRNEQGVWEYTSMDGRRGQSSEGPFRQAAGALSALRKAIESDLGDRFLARVPLGYGVLLPNCRFNVTSGEWEPWMVADKRAWETFSDWLHVLIRNWRAKVRHGARTLEQIDIEELTAFLRPSFERAPALGDHISHHDQRAEEFTLDQMRLLDVVEENPRVLCTGGAGTGKTFLAAELARRRSTEESPVLLACHSPWLAEFLRARVQAPGLTIRTIASLHRWPPGKPCQFLLVDEGQDLMNSHDLSLLDEVLVGGLADGNWCVFFDINNQAGVTGRFESPAFDRLRAIRTATVPLRRNCRNTLRIIDTIKVRTGLDLGAEGTGPGPAVEWVAPGMGVAGLQQALDTLYSEGVLPGQITILAAVPLAESLASKLPEVHSGDALCLDDHTVRNLPRSGLTLATISDFKGLENSIIILTDLDRIDDPQLRRTLAYVGMSRARSLLMVLAPPDLSLEVKTHV